MNPIALKPFQLIIEFKGCIYRGIAIPHLSLNANTLPSEFSVRFYDGIIGKLIYTTDGWISNDLKPARLATIIGAKINSHYDLLLE
jgi:hypothetical protein